MKDQIVEEEIKRLTQELNHYNYMYYQKDTSLISDVEFDNLLKQLQELEQSNPDLIQPDSPTQRVGGTITKEFETIIHKYPMLSLGNTYSEHDLSEFNERVTKVLGSTDFEFVCEQKYDGVAISLTYKDGVLSKAATRGDGIQGDDVTANVKTIKSIPLRLFGEDVPKYIEVRGEIFLPTSSFIKINKDRELNGENLLANPRNAASGTIKMQDSAIVAQRNLDCYIYGMYGENLAISSHLLALKKLKTWGFNVPDHYQVCKSIEEVFDYISYWDIQRFELPVATDGIVVKVNNYYHQEELGFTAKNPRWAISFKYKSEAACTQLESISFQVGRTGAVTPVANLKPVLLAGTIVKRASLHNANEIERLDIRINDFVFVEKGGEIIPKITGVDLNKRSSTSPALVYISNCPECHTKLLRNEGEAIHYCPNEIGCPPQIKGRIEHFIQRKALNIEGIGPETIEQLYKAQLIKDPADLYTLSIPVLINLDRMGQKSAENIIKGLEKSKAIPFKQVLFGIGIRFVGLTVAEKLAEYFQNIDAIIQASHEDLLKVPEIGDRIAQSVVGFFENPYHIEYINRLKTYGVQMESVFEEKVVESNRLSEKTFVISGVFQLYSRDSLKEKIESNGGKVLSAISSKLDFLVAGDNMGPAKREKAIKLGIKIIDESEFTQMLE
jgi:DNA ligase (NAD+)